MPMLMRISRLLKRKVQKPELATALLREVEACEGWGGNMKEMAVEEPWPERFTGQAPGPSEATTNWYAAVKNSSAVEPGGRDSRAALPNAAVKTVVGPSRGEKTMVSLPMRCPCERGMRRLTSGCVQLRCRCRCMLTDR